MARPLLNNERTLAIPDTAPADGTAKDVSRWTLDNYFVTGTFVGGWDIDLEGSVDGVTWIAITAGITAATAAPVDLKTEPKYVYMRVSTDAVGTAAGKPTVYLTGMDEGAWE